MLRHSGSVYLTVTGTSAEAGDDGQVGRGNRVNGLITPCRPMSLEAVAGKNPVSHVGKIYNVLARTIAEAIVLTVPEVAAAQCYMVSEIGTPVTTPTITHVRLVVRDGSPVSRLESRVDEIVSRELQGTGTLVDRFVAGTIELFSSASSSLGLASGHGTRPARLVVSCVDNSTRQLRMQTIWYLAATSPEQNTRSMADPFIGRTGTPVLVICAQRPPGTALGLRLVRPFLDAAVLENDAHPPC